MDGERTGTSARTIVTRASKRKSKENSERTGDGRDSLSDAPCPERNCRSFDRRRLRRRHKQKRVIEDYWVQCDREGCRKWRKVSKHIFQLLDPQSKWHCSMNSDPLFNSCDIAEEVSTSREPYAYRMECGELVWAKMAGWTPWPAVICKDPEEDWELVETDEDNDKIHMYHVIFLGKTKSRGWVPDDKIEPYTSRCTKYSKMANSGQGVLLATAKREAGSLVSTSCEERLEMCSRILKQLETGKRNCTPKQIQTVEQGGMLRRRGRPPKKKLTEVPNGHTAPRDHFWDTPGSSVNSASSLSRVSVPNTPHTASQTGNVCTTIPSSTDLLRFVLAASEGNPLQPLWDRDIPYHHPPGTSDVYNVVPSPEKQFLKELQMLEKETLSGLEDVEKLLASMDDTSTEQTGTQDSQETAVGEEETLLADMNEEMHALTESITDINNLLEFLN